MKILSRIVFRRTSSQDSDAPRTADDLQLRVLEKTDLEQRLAKIEKHIKAMTENR